MVDRSTLIATPTVLYLGDHESCKLIGPATGKALWHQPLPGPPVRWGLAIDSRGRVIVTLRDGKVLCFGSET